MNALAWPSIGFYCIFGFFVFYQQLHVKNFRGASQGFHSILLASTTLGVLTGIVYLGYYGWTVKWWAPFAIVVIGIACTTLGLFLERLVGAATLSLTAFIGWPISAYFMFRYIPSAA
jgi:hypothetical protein